MIFLLSVKDMGESQIIFRPREEEGKNEKAGGSVCVGRGEKEREGRREATPKNEFCCHRWGHTTC